METLETQINNEETKLSLLRSAIESTWPIYLVLFLVIAFGTYGVETLVGLDHKEYPFDGAYMITILGAFVYHVQRLYRKKLQLRDILGSITSQED